MNWKQIGSLVAMTLACGAAFAQTPIVYPAKGQSTQQQKKDTGECQQWSTDTTGVDPVTLAQQSSYQETPPQPQGEVRRGVVRGAVGGAVVGEIVSDDGGKGAAAGAIVGGMRGREKQRRRQQQYQQQQQAAQAQTAGQMDTYNRAFAACMEGRNYVLK